MLIRREVLKAMSIAAIAAVGSPAVQAASRTAKSAKVAPPLPALTDEQFVWCAAQAMIWGMPAVNLDLMLQAGLRGGAKLNQIVYWSRLLDWKCQTLTPNSDVIYLNPFFDTREVGPVVIEFPPADDGVINGTLMDAWQTPLEDFGPAGIDAGKGARVLILPPGYAGAVPDGYHVFRPATFGGYGLVRSILRSGSQADLDNAVAYGKRMRLYPLSAVQNPPPTTYIDAFGKLFEATIPYDARFYEHLAAFVQREPWLQRDRAMIDTLRTLGIEKGKAFAPDPRQRKLLDQGAKRAHAILDQLFEQLFDTPWAPGSRWSFLVSAEYAAQAIENFPDPNRYPIDERGMLFTFIFFSPRRLGEGILWLMTHKDAKGAVLDGGTTYRLRVPPNVPMRQYWSITLYDRVTHAFIREMPYTSRSSQTPGLQVNNDGSVDMFMGPTPPKGWEVNWLPSRAGQRFEALARFYGPERALFDRTWVLPDIERIG